MTTPTLHEPPEGGTDPTPEPPLGPPPPVATSSGPVPPRPARPRRPYVVGSLLIGGGLLWLLSTLGVTLYWDLLLPAGLIVVGAALLLTRGSTGGGLVGLGVLLLVLSLVVVPVTTDLSAEIGQREILADDLADLDGDPSLAIGSLILDLRDLRVAAGEEVTLAPQVGIGELRVRLPEGVEVVGEASAGIGSVVTGDRERGGLGIEADLDEAAADPVAGTLRVDASVGIGQVVVER